jgi:hypothetical protein
MIEIEDYPITNCSACANREASVDTCSKHARKLNWTPKQLRKTSRTRSIGCILSQAQRICIPLTQTLGLRWWARFRYKYRWFCVDYDIYRKVLLSHYPKLSGCRNTVTLSNPCIIIQKGSPCTWSSLHTVSEIPSRAERGASWIHLKRHNEVSCYHVLAHI